MTATTTRTPIMRTLMVIVMKVVEVMMVMIITFMVVMMMILTTMAIMMTTMARSLPACLSQTRSMPFLNWSVSGMAPPIPTLTKHSRREVSAQLMAAL